MPVTVQQLTRTRVNGFIPGWCQIEIGIANIQRVFSIQEINYKVKFTKSNVYGAGRFPLGQTVGSLEYEGDITMLLEDAMFLRNTLGTGYADVIFPITIKVRQSPVKMIARTVLTVSMQEIDVGYKKGLDPLMDKFSLLPIQIDLDGPDAVQPIAGVSRV